MMPKVAFVLTVYNKEAWIAQTLQTILNQSLKDIEVIVWDDGSTDGSMDIVKHYADLDSRIKVHGSKENQGISKAYNQAHKFITAPYVCVASADDLYDKHRARRTYSYFVAHPEKKVMYGNFFRVTASGKVLEHKICKPHKNKEDILIPNNQYIPHGFMSIRNNLLQDTPYDETIKYGVDYPWVKELVRKCEVWEIGRTKDDLGMYRWFGNNVSHQHRKEIVSQGNA